ncbi:MAG: YgaP family membrane protein [Sediminibacterium sp.]
MKKNMSSTDSIIRLILSAIMIGLYFTGVVTGTVGIVLLVLSGVFILTSVIRFCPLYTLFGITTCPIKKS